MFAIASKIHNILKCRNTKIGGIMHIEYLIKELRLEKHMSLRELHKKADVSVRTSKRDRKRIKRTVFFRYG